MVPGVWHEVYIRLHQQDQYYIPVTKVTKLFYFQFYQHVVNYEADSIPETSRTLNS